MINKKKTTWLLIVLGVGALAAVLMQGPLSAQTGGDKSPKACPPGCTKPCCAAKAAKGKPCGAGPCAKCRKMVTGSLSTALAAIDDATKAVEAGNKTEALAKLAAAKKPLLAIQAKIKKATAAKKPAAMESGTYANAKCPMMGGKIIPTKVTPQLTRNFKGKKVAFCCAGCLAPWDKLSDEQKQAKLDTAK